MADNELPTNAVEVVDVEDRGDYIIVTAANGEKMKVNKDKIRKIIEQHDASTGDTTTSPNDP